jgi:hypothetical protein
MGVPFQRSFFIDILAFLTLLARILIAETRSRRELFEGSKKLAWNGLFKIINQIAKSPLFSEISLHLRVSAVKIFWVAA